MQTTRYAYSYKLGTHPGRIVTTKEISGAYGVSKNHLVGVVQTLAEHEFIAVQAGRSGGLALGNQHLPHRAGVRVSRHGERGVERLLATLNAYTLADVLENDGRRKLASVFAAGAGVLPLLQ
jgi:hypothetical protein